MIVKVKIESETFDCASGAKSRMENFKGFISMTAPRKDCTLNHHCCKYNGEERKYSYDRSLDYFPSRGKYSLFYCLDAGGEVSPASTHTFSLVCVQVLLPPGHYIDYIEPTFQIRSAVRCPQKTSTVQRRLWSIRRAK
jgi:hypothetical protein